jgi:hypothetical protein
LRRCADVFVVTKLERLARSIADLMAVLQALERKRVVVRILNLGLDTQTPAGKLMLAVLGRVVQFERELRLHANGEVSPKRSRSANLCSTCGDSFCQKSFPKKG